jgi:2,3-dihydroxybiphenyl 1,2-dioxygenase
MIAVTQLGYVGFRVKDVAAWRRIATDIMGFQVLLGAATYLRVDDRHHRIALYPAADDGLAYCGWEAANASDFDALIARVCAAGVAVVPGSAAECADRRVSALAKFRDVNGFPMEIYTGPEDGADFVPPKPISGFKTGAMGLGHLVLRCADREAGVAFYCDALGFRVTDTADLSTSHLKATFLRCNARHHSLALTTASPESAGRVSHLMVEANAIEDVGRAYELCQANGLPIWLSLGQHTNDRMVSFYLRSPSGFGLELGYGAIEIDDTVWQVSHWLTGSHWGHKPSASP